MVLINKARGVTHDAEHTMVLLESRLACLCVHTVFYVAASHASYLLSCLHQYSHQPDVWKDNRTLLSFSCHLLLQISPHCSIIINAVFY